MLSENICELEEGVMLSVLRNASKSNTRLDKFSYKYRFAVSAVSRASTGDVTRTFVYQPMWLVDFFKVGTKVLSGE